MQRLALARFDALYLCLPLCVGFLLRWLQRLSLPSAPALRGWAAAVYVLHPWCIVLIRGGAGVVGLTQHTRTLEEIFLTLTAPKEVG